MTPTVASILLFTVKILSKVPVVVTLLKSEVLVITVGKKLNARTTVALVLTWNIVVLLDELKLIKKPGPLRPGNRSRRPFSMLGLTPVPYFL